MRDKDFECDAQTYGFEIGVDDTKRMDELNARHDISDLDRALVSLYDGAENSPDRLTSGVRSS
jgi:hypothetical protein